MRNLCYNISTLKKERKNKMEIYGYEIDTAKGFKCVKGNSEHTFKTYEEACEFQREHYGYTIIYYMAK